MKINNNQFKRRIFKKFNGYIKPLEVYKGADTKIKFQCVKGHIFKASPTSVYNHRNTGCSICNRHLHLIGGSKKMSKHQFNIRLQKIAHGKVKIISKYYGSNLSIKLQCLKGHVFERKPTDIIRDNLWKCPICKYNKKKSNFIRCLRYDHYKLLGRFKNNSTKVLVECSRGHKYMTTPGNFLRGSRCNKCKGIEHSKHVRANPASRYNHFFRKFKTKIGKQYCLLSAYINSRASIVIKHKKCGYKWTTTPFRFLKSKAPCPRCNPQNHSEIYTTKYMRNKVNKFTNGEYKLLGAYYGIKSKTLIKHNKCGNTFKMSLNNFLNLGNRCPYCSQSKGEDRINKILSTLPNKFIYGYRLHNAKGSYRLHLDFYLPKLRIGIEYDGVQHFRPVDFSGHKTWYETLINFNSLWNRDRFKDSYCAKHDVRLIRIPYTRFGDIKAIIRSKIIKRKKVGIF